MFLDLLFRNLNLNTRTDFRHSEIYPTSKEIINNYTETILRKNKIQGPYRNVNEYLSIHFELLREDFVKPLKEAINKYILQQKSLVKTNQSIPNLTVHENVTFLRNCERCSLFELDCDDEDDDRSLIYGSLVCFIKNSKTIIFGKIIENFRTYKHKRTITVNCKFNQTDNTKCTMIEYGVYFESYYVVLNALRELSLEHFPLKKFIVDVCQEINCPKYLKNIRQSLIENSKLLLNDMQYNAFKMALSKELVLIQGPPGTGKTHLGLKIVNAILEHQKYKHIGPILVIGYKNHALDQFLEGILKFTTKLVRYGRHSKSVTLQPYYFHNKYSFKDFIHLHDMDVIGMTTTAAARLHNELEKLNCPVLVVEEAAEVLESHVVVALTRACQHLILIGDHQQLRPKTADYSIGKNNQLGVSLFERLIINKLEYNTLNIQHRMRPEISSLISPAIYPNLKNHQSVLNFPPIRGITKSVLFINHSEPETPDKDSPSIMNPHEAKFLVKLAQHLLDNGYKTEDITILVAYKRQYQAVINEMHILENKFSCKVLDNYQGEESKIILLSLVRNNNKNSIGFLKLENRVCVALSRAKEGLYMMGNMELLCRNSTIWPKIRDVLVKQNAIVEKLPLYCETHKKLIKEAKYPKDFLKPPYKCCKVTQGELAVAAWIKKYIYDRYPVLFSMDSQNM